MGRPSVYLQGSYRNHTNIAGDSDSDVDVVVESGNLFYSAWGGGLRWECGDAGDQASVWR